MPKSDPSAGFRHRRLGIAVHVLVILGSGLLALTTNDFTVRVVNILVCAVAVLSVLILAIDPAGRRGRSSR
jgi:hypothetical protein